MKLTLMAFLIFTSSISFAGTVDCKIKNVKGEIISSVSIQEAEEQVIAIGRNKLALVQIKSSAARQNIAITTESADSFMGHPSFPVGSDGEVKVHKSVLLPGQGETVNFDYKFGILKNKIASFSCINNL